MDKSHYYYIKDDFTNYPIACVYIEKISDSEYVRGISIYSCKEKAQFSRKIGREIAYKHAQEAKIHNVTSPVYTSDNVMTVINNFQNSSLVTIDNKNYINYFKGRKIKAKNLTYIEERLFGIPPCDTKKKFMEMYDYIAPLDFKQQMKLINKIWETICDKALDPDF